MKAKPKAKPAAKKPAPKKPAGKVRRYAAGGDDDTGSLSDIVRRAPSLVASGVSKIAASAGPEINRRIANATETLTGKRVSASDIAKKVKAEAGKRAANAAETLAGATRKPREAMAPAAAEARRRAANAAETLSGAAGRNAATQAAATRANLRATPPVAAAKESAGEAAPKTTKARTPDTGKPGSMGTAPKAAGKRPLSDFEKAFAAARAKDIKEGVKPGTRAFSFKGKSYSTKLKGE